jgi:sulfoxide reductase heme-binding subunit YedZ
LRARRAKRLDWLQPAVLLGSLVPLALLSYRALSGGLGANPIATAMNQLGLLALLFLVATLACTPLELVLGWTWPLRVRKTLGLMAFYTVLLHFAVYMLLDQNMVLSAVLDDVLERPFIAFGFSAFVLLIPLALTSTREALAWLGPKRWRRLHRLVYLIAALGVIHFALRVKQDLTEPLLYGAAIALLLAIRAVDALRSKRA